MNNKKSTFALLPLHGVSAQPHTDYCPCLSLSSCPSEAPHRAGHTGRGMVGRVPGSVSLGPFPTVQNSSPNQSLNNFKNLLLHSSVPVKMPASEDCVGIKFQGVHELAPPIQFAFGKRHEGGNDNFIGLNHFWRDFC